MANFDAFVGPLEEVEDDGWQSVPRDSTGTEAPEGAASQWSRGSQGSVKGEGTPLPGGSPTATARKQRHSMFNFKMSPSFKTIMGGKEKLPEPTSPSSDTLPPPSDFTLEPQAWEQKVEECRMLRLKLEKAQQSEQTLLDLYETEQAQLKLCNERALQLESDLKHEKENIRQEKENTRRLELLLQAKDKDAGRGPGHGSSVEMLQLQSDLIKLQDERDAARADVKDVNDRLRSYLLQMKELKADKEELLKSLAEAREDAQVAGQETEDVKAEMGQVRQSLERKDDDLAAMQAEMDRLGDMLQKADEDKARLEREKAETVRKWREEMRKKHDLQREITVLCQGKAEAEGHLAEELKRNLSHSVKVVSSQLAQKAAVRGKEKLQKRVEELQAELERLQVKLESKGSGDEADSEDEDEDLSSGQSTPLGNGQSSPLSGVTFDDALPQALARMEQELADSQAELEGLRAQLEEVQEELETARRARQPGVDSDSGLGSRLHQEQLRRHQKVLEEKEGEVEKLSAELKAAQLRAEDLQAELDRHSSGSRAANLGASEARVAELQAALEEKTREVEQLKEETAQWDASYSESEKRVASLEKTLNQLLAQKEDAVAAAIKEVDEKLQEVQAALKSSEEARDFLQLELDEVAETRDAHSKDLSEKLFAIKRLEEEKEALQKRLDEVASLEQMSVLLQNKAQEKEAAFQQKDDECEGLRAELVTRDIRIKKFELEVQSLHQQLESTSSAFKDEPSVRGELMEAQQEVRRLKTEKEQAKQAHLEQMEGLAVRIRQLEAQEEVYKGKYGDMADAAVTLQAAEAAASLARHELADSRAHAESLRLELEAIRARAAEHQQRVSHLEANLELSRRELTTLHQEKQHFAGGWQARVAELEGLVEAERRRAAQAEAQAEAHAEERIRSVQARVQQEIDFLKSNAMSSLEEIQVLEGVVQKVEVYDIRMQPLHRLRLLQLSGNFTCAVCHTPGHGWGWRCVVPHCSDSIHLGCLTGRR